MPTILTDTKPNGAGRNWLEVGAFVIDDFGDRVWQPSGDRYPQKDPRLTVTRKYDGRGARQRIRWRIEIPENYPLTIVCRSGDSRHPDSVEWEPGA